MHKTLNANKAVLASRSGTLEVQPGPLNSFLRRFPGRLYNALFTPMGRKRSAYFIKRQRLNLNATYRKEGSLVYQLNNGQNFVVHRDNLLSELVFLEGAYEPLESQIVSHIVRGNDIVLDGGANVGYFTAILDRLVKPYGQVHAFEPGEGTFGKLQRTKVLLQLDRSRLHPVALDCTVGPIDFWSSTSGSDAQQKTVKTLLPDEPLRHDTVPATTVDAFVAGLQDHGLPPVAFIKCDIEGAEAAMLKGAHNLLDSEHPPVWLIEHNRPALADQGADSADLLAFFAG